MIKKRNKWTLEQFTSEHALEAETTKRMPSNFRHIVRRQESLEKTMMLSKRQ